MNVLFQIRQLIILFLIFSYSFANNDPIFLIHGFMGWGRDELTNHYYWGGDEDLQAILEQEGFEVYTLSVGPIS